MLGHRLSVFMVACTCALYGGQPVPSEQRVVEKKQVGLVKRSEQAIQSAASITYRLVLRTFGFTARYPRLTLMIVTVGPMAFPRYRYYVRRQAGRIVQSVTRKIGRWVQQTLRGWLLAPFDDRLAIAQQGLEEQHGILDGHTGQLNELQGAMHNLEGSAHNLLGGQELLHTKVLKMQEALSEHTSQLKVIAEKEAAVHEQVKSTHIIVENIKEASRAHTDQLASIAEQEGATSAQVKKATVSIDELYEQLVKLDGSMAEGKTETLERIGLLERHLGQLSEEQKSLFRDYGAQFSGRFDQLSENFRRLLEQIVARQPIPCAQQYRATIER